MKLKVVSGHEMGFYLTNVVAHDTLPLVLTSSSDCCYRLWDLRAQTPLVASVQAHAE